ncbi:F420-0:Gamma-glutamyl ligase [Neosynechococcus sphagnicola]|uniref:F420-0:Gamma-glutamyl ligase n=1 Tax=Neosynechococcus sphagnicola TaxID=1501145 RepID=UPI000B28D170|nr:F420-0:Gamma-glutamyl ligase [Neosynechococcus sphagnicola]
MILESLGIGIGVAILGGALGGLALELQYRLRPAMQLDVTAKEWNLEVYEPQRYQIVGDVTLRNPLSRFEIMVPEMQCQVTLLSSASLAGITSTIQIIPQHPDAPARADNYWFAYIVKSGKTTQAEIRVEILGADLSHLQAAWIQIRYVTYSPAGRESQVSHVVVPLQFPTPDTSQRWRPTPKADVLPIRTHLLTHLDHPVEVVRHYVLPHARKGDIVTLGETPVAIMQGRWRHPTQIRPGWVARRLCYFFLPTSSLATACGLQALVDIVGPLRVLSAFVIGAVAKVLGQPGMFYRLAGEQARLIDDVTGTLPPYDQFIVLGPQHSQQIVDQIRQETGLSAAIVDVNDLKAVKILAATADITPAFLIQALRTNPAGNADEQTPLVLIRPTDPHPPT